jgi:hypothetical protein
MKRMAMGRPAIAPPSPANPERRAGRNGLHDGARQQLARPQGNAGGGENDAGLIDEAAVAPQSKPSRGLNTLKMRQA